MTVGGALAATGAHKINTLTREISREEKIAKAVELRQEGRSFRQIAEWLGVHHQTVKRWVGGENATVSRATVAEVEGSDGVTRPASARQSCWSSRSWSSNCGRRRGRGSWRG
ncbi:helix-turn-helix domain-containing protein [Numidum massiliense]|uniref:helix-turn-helix domain-containing protein n=1 Tax=Numidum massiliense TaxID=1522315 RepID=UPI00093CD523|nr:helix-turn-helix domain-containing protein [Numidum massiliense]